MISERSVSLAVVGTFKRQLVCGQRPWKGFGSGPKPNPSAGRRWASYLTSLSLSVLVSNTGFTLSTSQERCEDYFSNKWKVANSLAQSRRRCSINVSFLLYKVKP